MLPSAATAIQRWSSAGIVISTGVSPSLNVSVNSDVRGSSAPDAPVSFRTSAFTRKRGPSWPRTFTIAPRSHDGVQRHVGSQPPGHAPSSLPSHSSPVSRRPLPQTGGSPPKMVATSWYAPSPAFRWTSAYQAPSGGNRNSQYAYWLLPSTAQS